MIETGQVRQVTSWPKCPTLYDLMFPVGTKLIVGKHYHDGDEWFWIYREDGERHLAPVPWLNQLTVVL